MKSLGGNCCLWSSIIYYQCCTITYTLTEVSSFSLPPCPVTDLEVWIRKSLYMLILFPDRAFWPLIPGLVDICWAAQLWIWLGLFRWKQRNLLRGFIFGTLGKEILELKFVRWVFEKDKLVLLFPQLCYFTFLLVQHTINQPDAHSYIKSVKYVKCL